VLHRENLDRTGEVIALAEELRADRLELANTQYLGWAFLNRQALLPTREQIERARSVAGAARKRLEGRMEVVFVVPDYYVEFPPACMDGWGRRFLVVSPDGLLLPCLLAHTVPGLSFGTCASNRSRSCGPPRPAFWRSGARTGCPSLAAAVRGDRSISAAAAARHST